MATKKVIEKFGSIAVGTKIMDINSKSWCPLCDRYFEDGEEAVTFTMCTHLRSYHKACIIGFAGHLIDLFLED